MLNIKRIDKVSNIRIHELIGIKDPLVLTVQRRQLRFVGHCLRKAENEFINKYVFYTPELSHENRARGQPKMLYSDYIGQLIDSETPPMIDDIRAEARNRQGWNRIVDACIPTSFAVD